MMRCFLMIFQASTLLFTPKNKQLSGKAQSFKNFLLQEWLFRLVLRRYHVHFAHVKRHNLALLSTKSPMCQTKLQQEFRENYYVR